MPQTPEERKASKKTCHMAWAFRNRERLSKYRKEWAARNRDRIKGYSRKYIRKFKYGISCESFDAMLTKQNGRCASCGDKFKGPSDTHLDHCHLTGKNRQILCQACNCAEGLLKTPVRIMKLYKYVKKWERIN